ncbi:MAG: ABC transporter permease [bacterium]|nr:ABC transporter permease [bacterium]
MNSLRDLWLYRRLLWDLVIQDFRSRYAGSVIGVFWNVVQPAAQVFIFAVLLARIIGARLPDSLRMQQVDDPFALSLYICAGLLPWIVFNETLLRTSTTFLAHSNLIKKVAFPHPLLVLYQVISGLITLAIMCALLLLVALITNHRLGLCLLWLPVLILLQGLFTYGLGLILASITAHFRDMPQIIGIILQLWFWLTPIVYPRDLVNALMPWGLGPSLLRINPLYHLTNMYQNILFKHVVYFDFLPNRLIPPTDQFLAKMAVTAFLSLLIVLAATAFYEKLRHELPDQI